ncbi:thermonuclease family protein [Mycoplasma sp. ES3157-GEN-MYC]|uniref:Uncharacterized protein n=1 Tax=Mycoplasma miroungigenitalium TaxID=754515 RepID=A0A6M4JCH0_9MOLU|nr:thermonuclease family protein [Mycoplasma miroungigenitalium]MBU4690636.1 thermonuclease family protein [Mycoplasma miroungigenitalium]MBU4691903.1 thermonuclease family protein [Mycoplasma miroungigenitalium]QJR43759.1 hypothetical protein HLA87_03150 [Mycoplasma miroungigenitalium]
MNFKRLLVSSALPLTGCLTTLSASCSQKISDEKIEQQFNELMKEKGNWEIKLDKNNSFVNKNIFKARVTQHADGDTIQVLALENNDKHSITTGKQYKIRLAGIDTPEKNVGGTDSDPEEMFWAVKASKFCEKVLKDNQIVYIYATGKDTYGRITADVFFSYDNNQPNSVEEAKHSYSVEITRAGWTLPYLTNPSDLVTLIDKGTLQSYTFYSLGLALKSAYDNKRGFFYTQSLFKKKPTDFSNIYKIKKLGESWRPFWKDSGVRNVFQYENYDSVYKPAVAQNK